MKEIYNISEQPIYDPKSWKRKDTDWASPSQPYAAMAMPIQIQLLAVM